MSVELKSTGISSVKIRFRPAGQTGPAGRSIVSASINGSGHLILGMSDATTVDAGFALGPAGPTGRGVTGLAIDGSGHLIITYSDATTQDAGSALGPAGPAGRGVTSATIASGQLSLSYSDGTTVNLGNVQGPQGVQGVRGPAAGLSYIWSAATDATDPGTGKVKVSSLSRPAVTQLHVSETDALGIASASLLGTLDTSTSARRALITIFDTANPTNFVAYATTGAATDNGAWRTFPVTYVDHSGTLTDGAAVAFQWARTGDKGDQGIQGPQGIQGSTGPAPGVSWNFSGALGDADPGDGTFRVNAASYPAATFLYVDNLDLNGADVRAWLDALDDSTNPSNKGRLNIVQADNAANFVSFIVTGTVVDATGYRRVPVTWLAGNGTLAGRCALTFAPTGNKGSDGTGGNTFGSAATGLDGQVVLFDADGFHLKSAGYAPGALASRTTINNADWSGAALAVANGGTGSTSASAARTALGLVIGTDVQAADAELAALAGLTSAADRLPYFTGTAAAALAPFTAYARTLVDDVDATTARGTLGLGALAVRSAVSAADLTASSQDAGGTIINGVLSATVATNVLTVALKTLAGTDPSASDPVILITRNATAATGAPDVLLITGALSVATAVGATFGVSNSVAFRLWAVLFNDGGTARLGLFNASEATAIYRLNSTDLATSTAIGAGSTSAGVFYTGTAVGTARGYAPLGYVEWSSGLATSGTFSSGPTTVQLFGPGVPLPGQVIQTRSVRGGASSTTSTSLVDVTGASVTLTPTAAPNRVRVMATASGSIAAGGTGVNTEHIASLVMGGVVDQSSDIGVVSGAGTNMSTRAHIAFGTMDSPGSTAARTYKLQHRTSTAAASATTNNANLVVEELQG
jgi:hypothetical protein